LGRGEVHTCFWWGETDEKRPLGRPRHKRENNIKINIQEVGLG